MTVPEEMKDLSVVADKLLKDKIERVTPVPLSQHEKWFLDVAHAISLPAISEIRKAVGLQILRHAVGISLFLAGWWWLSFILDEVAMVLGY